MRQLFLSGLEASDTLPLIIVAEQLCASISIVPIITTLTTYTYTLAATIRPTLSYHKYEKKLILTKFMLLFNGTAQVTL